VGYNIVADITGLSSFV